MRIRSTVLCVPADNLHLATAATLAVRAVAAHLHSRNKNTKLPVRLRNFCEKVVEFFFGFGEVLLYAFRFRLLHLRSAENVQ